MKRSIGKVKDNDSKKEPDDDEEDLSLSMTDESLPKNKAESVGGRE